MKAVKKTQGGVQGDIKGPCRAEDAAWGAAAVEAEKSGLLGQTETMALLLKASPKKGHPLLDKRRPRVE